MGGSGGRRGQSRTMSEVTPKEPEPQAETLDLISSEISPSLARQSDSGKTIDTKAVILVGYAVAAAAFLATRHAQPVLAALAYIAYAAAGSFGIWAYAIRLYQDVPDPRKLFNGYLERPKAEALAALAATRVEAFEDNTPKYRRKAARWWISLASLMVGVTLMLFAITIAAHTGHHGRPAGSEQRPARTGRSTATIGHGRRSAAHQGRTGSGQQVCRPPRRGPGASQPTPDF